jgi:two-component system sensor histidine kinase MtrB
VGLRPGESSLVFDRFWRADPSRQRRSGGTGLGLSISREDAHLHGGWLQAWGEPGHGAQFRLTLPRTAGATLTSSPLPLQPADRVDPPGQRASAEGTYEQVGRSTDAT